MFEIYYGLLNELPCYLEFIPADQHKQSKAETFTVQGYNSRIGHCLARFKGKGKCYSKAVHMIRAAAKRLLEKMEINYIQLRKI